jgi:hypothetical protein
MNSELPQFVTGETCWRISSVPDLPTFIRELPSLVPAGSILSLEDTISEDIERFLAEKPAIYPNETDQGFLRMRVKTSFTPLTHETAEGLADLAEHHAEPEVCSHLRVYSDGDAVLAWHDIVDDPVYINGSVDENRIRAFCNKLGTTYEGGVEPL